MGQDDGLRTIVQVYGPIVYRWVRRCGVQSADAADIMQDTLVAAIAAFPRFEYETGRSSFRGWLWTIARNKMRDLQRRQDDLRALGGSTAYRRLKQLESQPHEDASGIDEPPCTKTEDDAQAQSSMLEILRQKYDPRTWRMFWETVVVERQPADVAEEMGVSRWAIYKARARILSRLRQELDGIV